MNKLKQLIEMSNKREATKAKAMLLYLLIVMIAATLVSTKTVAQTRVTPDGNYEAVKKVSTKDTVLKWSGHTYTDAKGEKYNVYVSPKAGKLYILRVSKNTGKTYKQYLKLEN